MLVADEATVRDFLNRDPALASAKGGPYGDALVAQRVPSLPNTHDGRSATAIAAHRGRRAALVLFQQRGASPLTGVDALIAACALNDREAMQSLTTADALVVEELTPWLAWASVLPGWAMAMQGEGDEGMAEVRGGLQAWTAGGLACLQPFFLLLLAESQKANGQAVAARATVAEALSITQRTGEGYAEAELHRLHGVLMDDPEEADRAFRHALEIGRRQRARSRELRAAVSLAQLPVARRRPSARRTLSEVYEWFTEGFDTVDLQEAAAVLR